MEQRRYGTIDTPDTNMKPPESYEIRDVFHHQRAAPIVLCVDGGFRRVGRRRYAPRGVVNYIGARFLTDDFVNNIGKIMDVTGKKLSAEISNVQTVRVRGEENKT